MPAQFNPDDYSYQTICADSAAQAMAKFANLFPNYKPPFILAGVDGVYLFPMNYIGANHDRDPGHAPKQATARA